MARSQTGNACQVSTDEIIEAVGKLNAITLSRTAIADGFLLLGMGASR
jgi:hypothetical protein